MDINVNLSNIIESKFWFYLDNNYRNYVFSSLKSNYIDWRILARNLDIPTRNLFGIRRGWELKNNLRREYFISSYFLSNIINLSNRDIKEFERNLTHIKFGTSGRKSKISLPLTINLEKESIFTFNRVLAENVFIKNYTKSLKDLEESNYFKLNINRRTKKFIPKEIIFNEYFAKHFGMWYGDKCGGSRRMGLANKKIVLINSFKEFLKFLGQRDIKITLTCREDYKPSKNLIKNADKVELRKSQYGDYCYRVDIPHRELNQLVFNYFEKNIFDILRKSKKSVRYAFYAGLFDAEGSVDLRSNIIQFSFGFNLNKKRSNKEYLDLLKEVCRFSHLLNLDGFNSRISRKLCNTKKSKTLKYDIVILHSLKTRKEEIKFIKQTIFKYVSHTDRIKKFNELEVKFRGKRNKCELSTRS